MQTNGKLGIIIFIIFLTVIGSWLIGRYYRLVIYTPVNPSLEENLAFVINTGESGALVGKRLADSNLIRSPLAFRIYLRLNQLAGGAIQAGEYNLSPSMSLVEIVELFRHGTFDVKLTIPEGLRIEQIAELLVSNFEFRASDFSEEFLEEAKTKNFSYGFLKDSPEDVSLEGFLFPDTYFAPKDINSHELIDLMLKNFDEKFDNKLREDLKKQNLNTFEALIFASIVEREAKKEEDRPLVAGILMKRYKNGWPLEADATTQFAIANAKYQRQNTRLPAPEAAGNGGQVKLEEMEWWKENLTKEDLEIDSPYNTRKYPNLPPGPIANPGLSSIKAVVYPKESDFWYYVSDEEGNIYYSQTLEEHQTKVAKYAW